MFKKYRKNLFRNKNVGMSNVNQLNGRLEPKVSAVQVFCGGLDGSLGVR